MINYKHLFGPVPSRRLGISLGVDVIPAKTCTLDCVYCECGSTTNLTLQRKIFFPTQEIINELQEYLAQKPKLDYITFAGSGEPTLALNLGEIIKFLKKNFPAYQVALLTNGTLLNQPEVRNEVLPCDLVKISLDAASKIVFNKINRPAPELDLGKIIAGIQKFCQEYTGKLWLEIFVVPGLNDNQAELQKIKEILHTLKSEKIQINSLDRPGAESWVELVTPEQLQAVADYLQPLPCEIVKLRPAPKEFFKKIKK